MPLRRRLSRLTLAWILLTPGCVRTRTVSVPIPVDRPPCLTAPPPVPAENPAPDTRAAYYVDLTAWAWEAWIRCRPL